MGLIEDYLERRKTQKTKDAARDAELKAYETELKKEAETKREQEIMERQKERLAKKYAEKSKSFGTKVSEFGSAVKKGASGMQKNMQSFGNSPTWGYLTQVSNANVNRLEKNTKTMSGFRNNPAYNQKFNFNLDTPTFKPNLGNFGLGSGMNPTRPKKNKVRTRVIVKKIYVKQRPRHKRYR